MDVATEEGCPGRFVRLLLKVGLHAGLGGIRRMGEHGGDDASNGAPDKTASVLFAFEHIHLQPRTKKKPLFYKNHTQQACVMHSHVIVYACAHVGSVSLHERFHGSVFFKKK